MLNLGDIAGQATSAMERWQEREARRQSACEALLPLASQPPDPALKIKPASYLVAHSDEPLGTAFLAPEIPASYLVVATDGSQVVPDRHDGFEGVGLVHTGRVRLVYGTRERARLDAIAEVFFDDEDEDTEPGSAGRLALRRLSAELTELATLAEEAALSGLPALALTDGSLIAWMLAEREGARDDPHKRAAREVLLNSLERCRIAGVPVAGYVSGPGSRDAVNGLRLGIDQPDTGLTDARLFARTLALGERSPVFTAWGRQNGFPHVLSHYGPAHWIGFFYLNVGAEIARVELPQWAISEHLELVHALCLDQATKGRGYPVALAEAHERAVVREPDRQAFLNLLTRSAVKTGIAPTLTRKALAKRARSV
jgi:hypothetical protein